MHTSASLVMHSSTQVDKIVSDGVVTEGECDSDSFSHLLYLKEASSLPFFLTKVVLRENKLTGGGGV